MATHLWDPEQFIWDPEKLVAVCDEPAEDELSPKTKGRGKAAASKRRYKSGQELHCQIDGCGVRLDSPYYRKYRVCPNHAKSPAVVINGQAVRFCQKCARFHDLGEFDMDRRSCRLRLAEHNRRRREMMQERRAVPVTGPRPTASREPSADETNQTGALPPAAIKAEPAATASGSVYHSPCNSSDRSLSDRMASVNHGGQGSVFAAPMSPRSAAVSTMPDALAPIGIEALRGPTAATLHSIDDLFASMPGAAPLVAPPPSPTLMEFQRQQGLPSYLMQNLQDPVAVPGPPLASHSLSASAAAAALDDISLDDALGVADMLADPDMDLALAGILDPVVDPELPPPPPYVSLDAVVRLSLKLFACLPTDLPVNLRVELERTLTLCPSLCEGYVRPGCVHLTLDLRVPADEAEQLLGGSSSSQSQQDRLVELASKVPGAEGALAQLGRSIAVVRDGAVLGAADAGDARAPRLAALSRVCVSVDEAEATRVDLYGANIGRAGDIVLCRQHGRHVTVEMLETAAWAMQEEEDDGAPIPEEDEEGDDGFDGFGPGEVSLDPDDASATGVLDLDLGSSSVRSAASSDAAAFTARAARAGAMPAASVRLLGLRCGVAEMEVQAGGLLSAPRPLLVLPDAAAAAEVESLACRSRRAPWLDSFLRDAGLVVAHICSEGAAARAPASAVEALAARTAAYCTEARCPALGRLLRRAQTALRRSLGTDDTAEAMAKGGGMSSKGKGVDACGVIFGDFAAARTAAIEQDVSLSKRRTPPGPAPAWTWSGAVGVAVGVLAMAMASRLLGGGHV